MYTSVGVSHILLVCIFNMDISILMATATSCHSVGKVCGSQNWRQYRRYIYNRAGDIITRRQSCTKRQYFDISEGRCSGIPGGGYIVFVDNNAACNIAGLIPHPTEARYYRVCKSYKVIVAKCQRPANFNTRRLHCGHRYIVSSRDSKLNKSNYHPKLPVCVKEGQFPSPNTCSSYYMCRRNGTRFVQTEYKCPQNSVYNATLGNCDIKKECKLKNTSTTLLRPISNNEYPKCTAAGKVYVPSNCTMYCMCSSRRSGDFIRECYSCPSGYVYDPNIEDCAEGSHCIQDVEETKYDLQQSVLKIIPQISTSAPYVTSEFKDTAVTTTPQLNERTNYHNTPFVRTSELPEYTSVSHPMKYDNTEGADIMNINKQSHHNITQLYPVVDSFEYPKQAYITIKSSTIESYQMDFQSTTDTDTLVFTANKSRKKNFTEKDTPKFVMQTHSTLTINVESQNVTEQTLSDIKIYEEKHVVSSKSLKAADTEFQPTQNTADKVQENKQEFIRPSVASNCISCSETQTIYSKEQENVFENRTEQSFKAPLTTTHSPLNCCKAGQSGLTVSMTQACIETNLLSSECAQTSLPEAVNSSELTCINVNPKPQPTMEPISLYRDFILKQTQEEHSETDIAEQITPSKTASTTAAHGNKYIHWDWQQTQEINILTADTEISEFQPEEKNVTPSLTKYWQSMLKPAAEHMATEAEHELESSAETEFRTSTYNTQHSNTVTKVISKELPETSSTSILVLKAKEEYTTISETAEQQRVTNNVTHLPPLQTASKTPKPYTEPEDIKTESFLPQTNDTLSKAGPIQHVTASLFTQLPQLQNTNTKQTAHTELENNINSASLPLLHLKEVTPIAYSDQHGISATTFQPQLPATRTTLTGYSELENNTTPITSTIIHAITTEFEVFTTKQGTASHPTTLPSELEINSGKTHFSDSEQSKKSRLSSKSLTNIDVTKPLSEKQDILVHTSSSSLLHKISTTRMGKSDAENKTVSAVLQNSTTGHSDLENITVSTQSLKSQLSTVAPNIYSNGQETAPIMTFLPLSEKTSKVPTSYTDPGYKTVPPVSQTSITGKEASFVQQVTVLPLTPLPLQRSSTEVGPYSEVNNVTSYTSQSRLLSSESHSNHQRGTSNTSPLPPLQTVSTTRIFYTYPDNITTVSLMPIRNATLSDAYSPEQVTASLTTLLTPFQSSNTKPETHSEADNNTSSTRLPLPYSKQVAPEGYSDQHGISTMTFLPPFPTTKTMEITDSDPVNNTSLKISTTLESNIIQSESLTSKHKITSLPTLLPSQHKISTEQKTCSQQETYKTSACSLISMSSSKGQKDFTNKQDVLTYTSSPLFQISTTISETYSNKENNTISRMLQTTVRGHPDLDNSTSSTSSQTSRLSNVVPNVYTDDQETKTFMAFSPLSQMVSEAPKATFDPDDKPTSIISSFSQMNITDLKTFSIHQVNTSSSTFLPFQSRSTEVAPHLELSNDTTSINSSMSQSSTVISKACSDEPETTSLPLLFTTRTVPILPIAFSNHHVNTSFITMSPQLQNSNTKTITHSEHGNNTTSTDLCLSNSNEMAPKVYCDQPRISATTFLSPIPTGSRILLNYSHSENNTTPTITTTVKSNQSSITEFEPFVKKQVTALPPTHFPSQQKINSGTVDNTYLEKYNTSTNSPMSLPNTEIIKTFSVKQEVSAYTTSSPQLHNISTTPVDYSDPENNTISTVLQTSTTGHSGLDNNAISTSLPIVYADHKKTTTVMTYSQLSETINNGPTSYTDPEYRTVSSVSETIITESDGSLAQQITASPLGLLPLQRSSTELEHHSELKSDTTSYISLTSQLSMAVQTEYSDPDNVTTLSKMSEPTASIHQVTPSLITLLLPLQSITTNKNIAAYSKLDSNTNQTGLNLSQSKTIVPKTYSNQNGASDTSLPSLPTNSITLTTFSDLEYNTIQTISTILQTNVTEIEAVSSQQITASPSTLLSPEQEINTKQTNYSDPETNTTSASSLISLTSSEDPKDFSDKQEISTYTSSPLFQIMSTVPGSYSYTENNTVTYTTTTGHFDLDNNISTTSSQMSQLSTVEPSVYNDQEITNYMAFLPLSETGEQIATVSPDHDNKSIPTISTLSESSNTESEVYTVYQVNTTTLTFLPFEKTGTKVTARLELSNDTNSNSSQTSQSSTVIPKVYSDEQETTAYSTSSPPLWTITTVQNDNNESDKKTIASTSSILGTYVTVPNDYSVIYTVSPATYLSTVEESKTVLTTSSEQHMEGNTEISSVLQSRTFVSKSYSDQQKVTADAISSQPLQAIHTTPTAYSDPDSTRNHYRPFIQLQQLTQIQTV
ncbi:hypothetical protein L798_03341 [Zootermopsis nevadensis]|uniref:Chitin-binding type-2 domain-containing protein n=1 Tax=Zootermopsis nevadensis TaxID=136037 RepID=A0A067RMG7_ZOONE|nr:hypothetical protein L798_03341 [Zootermopsis nevadensis]